MHFYDFVFCLFCFCSSCHFRLCRVQKTKRTNEKLKTKQTKGARKKEKNNENEKKNKQLFYRILFMIDSYAQCEQNVLFTGSFLLFVIIVQKTQVN